MDIRYINDYQDIVAAEPTVLVLGYFDGLHLGHKVLFEKACDIARQDGLTISVLTFPESPQLTFARFRPDLMMHLTSVEQRYAKFEEYGVDKLYLIPFTSQFAKTSSDDFIRYYIHGLKAQALVVGFDYQFGSDCRGSSYLSEQTGLPVTTVSEVSLGGEKISSTRIRKALLDGNIGLVNQLLGYTFSTRGLVVHGDARGRTIGFPTANLAPVDRTHLPADGVYVSEVLIGGKTYRGMTSVGKNTTFGGTELRIETHIFEFEETIYGETVDIFWLDKIRDMVTFDSVEDLIKQLHHDQNIAKKWTQNAKKV
ncbi:bifunctional riboflavin kinase/FAD synthetase [Streptococcus plurextorum]|uniref:bifunctional riboflavin kinase/FAD synthetase n=1 Tax=Streptococcus plurextorum TaxID=456876 RepID=UPI0004227441|nr:bifunctional riboflavin kinase/FAD synthetase [Streptococcus plurextorum]